MATDSQLHVLQHSLGLDKYGEGNQYRNHFVTGPGSTDWDDCNALVAAGLMKDHGTGPLYGQGSHCFTVTRAGKEYVAQHSPKRPPAPKLTRSQRRYREWLHSSSGFTFGEWLKRKTAQRKWEGCY